MAAPIHRVAWKAPNNPRDAVWKALRQGKSLSIDAIAKAASLYVRQVRPYLGALVAAEIVTDTNGEFLLVKDEGVHAPKLRADGSRMDRGKANAWRGIRILKTFTMAELHVSTGVSHQTLKAYLRFLVKAGYLKVQQRGVKVPTFKLIPARDTGPAAPAVAAVTIVLDMNQGEVAWPTERDFPEMKMQGERA